MGWLKTGLLTLTALIAWTAIFVFGTLNGWWRSPVAPENDSDKFLTHVQEQLESNLEGNSALILIEDGKIVHENYSSIGTPVDRDSLFQVASLGKFVAAWGVMTLVETGHLELDTPVSSYLNRWQLPKSGFGNEGVTVRRLLSHTAGLTDGLGYAGVEPGTPTQPIEDSLTHASDASPGNDGRTRVGQPPGEGANYSGGGYTLLQLLIEEVSGMTYEAYMQQAVFEPLGMTRSKYTVDLETEPNLAENFNLERETTPYLSFTSSAATGLYTTAADMARFAQANLNGAPTSLSTETLTEMRSPQAFLLGQPFWAPGVMLFAPDNGDGHIFGYDGSNEPAITTTTRINTATQDAIVFLMTGHEDLAARIGDEWIYWQTGTQGPLQAIGIVIGDLPIIATGWLLILIGGIIYLVVFPRKGRRKTK